VVIVLNINNLVAEREIKKTIPFTTVPKRMKYLGINNKGHGRPAL